METKRLYRSNTDKMIGGVCGGLGKFLGVDTTIIRLVFAITFFFGGGGLLLYLIMWAITPIDPTEL